MKYRGFAMGLNRDGVLPPIAIEITSTRRLRNRDFDWRDRDHVNVNRGSASRISYINSTTKTPVLSVSALVSAYNGSLPTIAIEEIRRLQERMSFLLAYNN